MKLGREASSCTPLGLVRTRQSVREPAAIRHRPRSSKGARGDWAKAREREAQARAIGTVKFQTRVHAASLPASVDALSGGFPLVAGKGEYGR